jgi:hypothetical protein
MTCMICLENKETRFIPLYIMGSEGTHICHECEMEVVDFIQKLMRKKGQIRKYKKFPKRKYAVRIRYFDPDEYHPWENIDPIVIDATSPSETAQIAYDYRDSFLQVQEIRVNRVEDEDVTFMGQGYYFRPETNLAQI